MTDIRGQIWPQTFSSGQTVKIRVENLPSTAREAMAIVAGLDSVETRFVMSLALELGGNGTAYADVEIPPQLLETAMFVESVAVDGVKIRLPMVSFSICDPASGIGRSDLEVITRYNEILQEQNDRYGRPIGDPTATGAITFRVACIVQGLLLTSTLRLPGLRAFGMQVRPQGKDAEDLARALSEQLEWSGRPLQPGWSQAFERDHHTAAIVFDTVYAQSVEEAFAVCAASCAELIAVLAVNRGAAGKPIVMCLEEVKDGQGVSSKYRFEHQRYAGNLIGGFLSGESQFQLFIQQAALHHDPLLRLCVDLYREAIADASPDARYFRLWSVLETLAIGRVPSGQPVQRLDGSPWPGNLTSSAAAPRVYSLIADSLLRNQNVDEASSVSPATDLATAVTHWYARRNATAHYGRFVPGDSNQISANWYSKALATMPAQAGWDHWLESFQQTCSRVLSAQMSLVGRPLL